MSLSFCFSAGIKWAVGVPPVPKTTVSRPWTETSETGSQNEFSPPETFFTEIFFTVIRSLTNKHEQKYGTLWVSILGLNRLSKNILLYPLCLPHCLEEKNSCSFVSERRKSVQKLTNWSHSRTIPSLVWMNVVFIAMSRWFDWTESPCLPSSHL
jgi:hypothetical protein